MEHFSCNLLENARKHKFFLAKIHELGVSIAASTVVSLNRYRHLWLNLLHKHHGDETLIPPPDVAWLWHCHRLAPKEYTSYVLKAFGMMMEANPPFTLQCSDCECTTGSAAGRTRLLWYELYPNEPFFLIDEDTQEVVAPSIDDRNGDELVGDFDLLGSTERQAAFLWQVSGERFEDNDFLEEGIKNYANFLKLMPKAAPKTLLVPTYQIDLMWHTHILTSITDYNNDCKALMGRTLHHDDSLTDRSDGGVLDVAYTATKRLWQSEYGCDYAVAGGMYRGEPPKEFFRADWDFSDDIMAGGNRHLVGKIGASSTSPPATWARVNGLTSDGKPAFIPTNTIKRTEGGKAPKSNYVLGRHAGVTGYFHIETKEANQILYRRMQSRYKRLAEVIAMENSCCAAPVTVEEKVRKEKKLAAFKEARDVLRERAYAPKPTGRRSDSTTNPKYYGDGGAWIYPVDLYNCAGGACGGKVACGGGGCGGAACGAGGCGGGGCGGGGCGG